ncbi:MAG: hypothetical protein L0226_04035 [Acidobacteria bacterium]|nr:hypothetical protein [Acidobacteriota bacterium]
MAKKKISEKIQIWIDARRKYHLSHAQVQMARELGLNPKKFGKLGNHRQEPWKMPLPQFIEHLYFKRFGKTAPDRVFSIEERLTTDARKKQEERERNQANAAPVSAPASTEQPGDIMDKAADKIIVEG